MAAALKMARLSLDSNPESGLMILPGFYFAFDKNTQSTRIGLPKGEEDLTDRIHEILDDIIEQDLYRQWYEKYREYAKTIGIQSSRFLFLQPRRIYFLSGFPFCNHSDTS